VLPSEILVGRACSIFINAHIYILLENHHQIIQFPSQVKWLKFLLSDQTGNTRQKLFSNVIVIEHLNWKLLAAEWTEKAASGTILS
jgi:hypothetical protein